MHLVVPMTGQGSRFKSAGYKTLKPLIVVDGKPIIAHLVDSFPNATRITIICAQEHLDSMEIEDKLRSFIPNVSIVGVPAGRLGPVYALTQSADYIDDDEPIMVSYCDYAQSWDTERFEQQVAKHDVAGAVPAYTGFHPHLWRPNVYAGIRTDKSGLMVEIREKHCFTPNPMDCHHSSGAYFFRTGALLKEYSNRLLDTGNTINGEYYVSMIYPLMLEDRLSIAVPEVETFMQWGTPEDLEEYEAWGQHLFTKHQKTKLETEIPKERHDRLTIPHQPNSPLYNATYNYWKKHHNL